MSNRSAAEKPGGKNVPQRSCVACGTVRPKRELVRLVRTPEGVIAVDTTWRRPGRGACLCPAQECWEQAVKRKSLERQFARPVSPHEQDELEMFSQTLPRRTL